MKLIEQYMKNSYFLDKINLRRWDDIWKSSLASSPHINKSIHLTYTCNQEYKKYKKSHFCEIQRKFRFFFLSPASHGELSVAVKAIKVITQSKTY